MKKKICMSLLLCFGLLLSGCGKKEEAVTLQVFAAASLSDSMEEIIQMYQKENPNVEIALNADSSGTLLNQVKEGYACDIFFSASASQVNTLLEEGYALQETKVDLLENQVVLITYKGSNTQVTDFDNMNLATSIALADGSVPVGKYTRNIFCKLGMLTSEEPAQITTQEISEMLGGVEINECSNVSKVKESIKEHNNEVGTVYYSDAYSIIEEIDILAYADTALTGKIVYPVVQCINEEATSAQTQKAEEFLEFLQGPEALEVFEKHMFVIAK